MALTPTIENSQLDVTAVTRGTAADLRAAQADVTAVFNIPTEEVQATQVDVSYASLTSTNVEISQLDVLAIYRGRIEDPALRAWTFTLDGHDFYVLNLGADETLVFDLSTGEWFTWATGSSKSWRAKTGINWNGAQGIFLQKFGSNVLVGDDSLGLLYMLDPNYQRDDVDEDRQSDFSRSIMAQYFIDSGYYFEPCYGIQVFGSVGDFGSSNTADIPENTSVELEVSDNRGKDWVSVGLLQPPLEDYDFRLTWQSLGSMRAPGRLFRLTDFGSLKRVDGFQMEGLQNG